MVATETREGTREDMQFGPFPAKKHGVDFLQPADEQHEAEVAGEILTCTHVCATLVSKPPRSPRREKGRRKSL